MNTLPDPPLTWMIETSFGWDDDRLDLGDLTSARAVEQLVGLWVRLYGMLGTGDFNFAVVR